MPVLDSAVLEWLLNGDPSIRWQVMRDLLDAPAAQVESERARIQAEGDGARLLAHQDPDGGWGGGYYTPKWTSSTYTLLLMREMGFDSTCPAAARGGQVLIERVSRTRVPGGVGCTCMTGMWLALGLRFAPGDSVYGEWAAHLLAHQMPDGGWNCRWPRINKTHHSSFHTTLNVLDGIQEANRCGIDPTDRLRQAESQAIELLLQHRMFRSDKTGEIINPHFTELHFPPRWHYDVLRGLDYIRSTPFIRDARLDEAFQVLQRHQREDGRWPAAKAYGGKVFFNIDPGREGSRWNTLRALRSLRARAA